MQIKKLDQNAIMQVQTGLLQQILLYNPFPISQSGQKLDLTQDSITLMPERENYLFR